MLREKKDDWMELNCDFTGELEVLQQHV